MNGLVMGVKGFLSFLSAPLIGSLSDSWGRRYLLLITVCFTCIPIPFLAVNSLLFFILISLSGAFAVTFTVVFAYVADITSEEERSSAYGLVSATFAASLVISPALGAWISQSFGDVWVILLATLVAAADVAFIYCCVPESLDFVTKKSPSSSPSSPSSSSCSPSVIWESIKRVADPMILILCLAVLLSYLPEAGQYSCFFVYIRLVLGFSAEDVALFIAVLGLLSVVAQTGLLSLLMLTCSPKRVILIGLSCQASQLLLYGVSRDSTVLWLAAVLAAVSSITYPAISCYVSRHADPDKQGLVQGLITGVRGLCNGLGPALFGFTFDLFDVDLSDGTGKGLNLVHTVTGVDTHAAGGTHSLISNSSSLIHAVASNTSLAPELLVPSLPLIPGPPFVLGSLMVLLAMLVTSLIPTSVQYKILPSSGSGGGSKTMPGARAALVSRSSSSSNAAPASGSGEKKSPSNGNVSTPYSRYFYATVEQERDCEPMIRRKHRPDDDDDEEEDGEEDEESRSASPVSPASNSSFAADFEFASTRLRSKTTSSAVQLDIPLLLPVAVGQVDDGEPL